MRVTVVGINYHPETTGIGPFNTGLCEYLAKDHEVEMISTFSYYPLWKKIPEEEKLLFRTDEIGPVTVHRGWHYVPAVATAIKRMVPYPKQSVTPVDLAHYLQKLHHHHGKESMTRQKSPARRRPSCRRF